MSNWETNKEDKENWGAIVEPQKEKTTEALIQKVLFQEQRIRELSSAVAELQALRHSDLQQIASLQVALSESRVKAAQIACHCIEDAIAVAEEEAAEELYRRGDYALYCVNNGDPEDVSDYLGFIGKYILQALANLGEEGLTAAKRVAAMVLVDALNKWFNLRRDENLPAASHVEGTETHQLVQSSIPDPGGIERGLSAGDVQSCYGTSLSSSPPFHVSPVRYSPAVPTTHSISPIPCTYHQTYTLQNSRSYDGSNTIPQNHHLGLPLDNMSNEVIGVTSTTPLPEERRRFSSPPQQYPVHAMMPTGPPHLSSGVSATPPSKFNTPSVAERRLQRRKAEEFVLTASAASGLECLGSHPNHRRTTSDVNSELRLSKGQQRKPSYSAPSQGLGLLLPLDYSGMEDDRVSEMNILSEIDNTLISAIKTRLETNSSLDTILDILVKYNNELADLALPRPRTVDFDQAMKDAKRETIYVNEMIFKGDAEKLMRRLQLLVLPLVGGKEKNLASAVCRDIIRASSRTAGGGDAYCVLCSMFRQSNDGYMITPKAAQSKPITVVVDGERGEVCIAVDNSFLLKRFPEDGVKCEEEKKCPTQQQSRSRLKQWVLTTWRENFDGVLTKVGLKSGAGVSCERSMSNLENRAEVTLDAYLMVHLSLLDGSCKRSLSITSPLIEDASRQYIALGAGSSVVNGTFDLSGWHNGGPVYVNASGVSIAIKQLGARMGWVIGEKLPSVIYYGNNPGELNRMRPLHLHWTLVAGGVGEDPPPTLMSSSVNPRQICMTHSHEM